MSCTRRKESASAIVIGSAGTECRWRLGHRRFSLGFDPFAIRIVENDDADLLIEPLSFRPDAPVPFTVAVLSDATPAEVYA